MDEAGEFRVSRCPVCDGSVYEDCFLSQSLPIVRCRECGLMLRNPQPSDEVQQQIYDENYFLWSGSSRAEAMAAELKQATADLYLDRIADYVPSDTRHLLEVGCGHGDFLLAANRRGYDVSGVEFSASAAEAARAKVPGGRIFCGELENADLPPGSVDVCVMADVIEHVRDPFLLLTTVHRTLTPGGTLFLVTPSLDSFSARLLGQRWMEFKLEHLYYFNRETLRRVLTRAGFGDFAVSAGRKILNLEYITAHFERFPVPVITPCLQGAARVTPNGLWRRRLMLGSGGIIALARALTKQNDETAAVQR